MEVIPLEAAGRVGKGMWRVGVEWSRVESGRGGGEARPVTDRP